MPWALPVRFRIAAGELAHAELIACINHHGGDAASGHYTCNTRGVGGGGGVAAAWFCHNDDSGAARTIVPQVSDAAYARLLNN